MLALVGACVACRQHQRPRVLHVASAVVAVVAVSAMTPLVANLLVGWLERPAVQSAACAVEPPRVAVVMAGGVDAADPDDADVSALGITSRRRMERAVTWLRAEPGRRLVVAGGPTIAGGVPPSRLMVRYSQQLGVDAGSMRVEENSVNTWENASHLAHLPGMPRRVALVTSAMHLPRASFAMRQAGFEVCPVPADRRRVALGWPGAVIPRSSALRKTEAALHEMVGLLWYRLRALADATRQTMAREDPTRDDLA
ncbi:MAG: YdcF family protein [Lysobacter sp.]